MRKLNYREGLRMNYKTKEFTAPMKPPSRQKLPK